eukprot:5655115-Pleurochrysis_carterae.AAC.1
MRAVFAKVTQSSAKFSMIPCIIQNGTAPAPASERAGAWPQEEIGVRNARVAGLGEKISGAETAQSKSRW